MPGRMRRCSSARARRCGCAPGRRRRAVPPRPCRRAAGRASRRRSSGCRWTPAGSPRDHQEVVGAVEIGHGERDGAAEHQAQRHVLGHLVDGARGDTGWVPERPDDRRRVQRARDGVDVGVAEVDANRVTAVLARPRRRARRRPRRTPRPRWPRHERAGSVGAPAAHAAGRGRCASSADRRTLRADEPALKTSSRSPRTPVTRPSSMVTASPQVASHNGQTCR